MAEYPIRFKAAILERNNEPLSIDEVVFEGPLKKGQVLVRIYYSGICGKQIEEISATAGPDRYLPHMLGHEGSGIVVDTGSGVEKVRPGDHVVLHWLKGSGIDAATPAYKRGGKRVNAGWVTTFNEYGVISENRLTPINKRADMFTACLLGCAVTTGLGVILNEAKPSPSDSVLVFGCGGIGLFSIQGARITNSYPIIAVDKNTANLELAAKFGASHTIRSDSNDVVNEAMKITGGKGANVVIAALGDPVAIEVAVGTSSIPGRIYFVGVPAAGARIAVDPLEIHRRKTLLGSHGGGCVPERDIPKYMNLCEKGLVDIKGLIADCVGLGDINQAIDSMISGKKAGRCVLEMPDK